jgi:cytochrome c-type biogenesis protein CcmH
MGWLILAVLGGSAAGLLWRLRLPRMLWTTAAAALMLGATGYALQGSPTLAGSPARQVVTSDEVVPELSELRLSMFGRFTYAEPYFVASDGMIRSGNPATAIRLLLAGIDGARDNAALWTALGQAYAVHDGGTLSPAARLAFNEAMRLAPEHPGPPFFLGLVYAREGKFEEARTAWRRALRLSPAEAPYRSDIAVRLLLVQRLLDGPLEDPR